jgi:hypothetical protein
MFMRATVAIASLFFCISCSAAAQTALSPDDEAAAFRAAGFTRTSGQWQACGDPGTASYSPGAIDSVADLNGDGLLEAFISEGSVFCFGNTGVGYTIVSRQRDGNWKLVTGGPGIPMPLESKGADGWADLEIGGPGFCFPVERWNGSEYQLNRHEYEGKACNPGD